MRINSHDIEDLNETGGRAISTKINIEQSCMEKMSVHATEILIHIPGQENSLTNQIL